MASGQIFGLIPCPPGTSAAPLDWLVGAATPAENAPIAVFADASSAYMDFYGTLQGYGGGGLTLKIRWSALSVTTNNCVWQAAIRRVLDDGEDFNSTAHSYDFNTVVAPAPSAVGEISYDDITFTNGADMDSLANGEAFVLRILRDPAHGSDDLADTAQLWWPTLILMET